MSEQTVLTEADKDQLFDAAERFAKNEKHLQDLRKFVEFAIKRMGEGE